jgi:hypothetical protein
MVSILLWYSMKDAIGVLPMLNCIRELITRTIQQVDERLLGRTWTELDYQWDICRVTIGAQRSMKWF